MNHNLARDQRRGGRGTGEGRKRRQMRPKLMALEDRRLLSTIVVNNPTDTPVVGLIDLRQAIAQANTNGGAETIVFDKTVFKTPQTITLNGTQLELSDTTGAETITGPKAGVTVSGDNASRVFQVDGGVMASISGLTITGGNAGYSSGGGLLQQWHDHALQLHCQRQLRHPQRHLCHRQRRRRSQLRQDQADQLHRQRKPRRLERRRPVHQLRRHDHADQLHRQRKLLHLQRRRREHRNGHDHADRLHRQRKLRHLQRRRCGRRGGQHGHVDRLHRQRKHRRNIRDYGAGGGVANGGGTMTLTDCTVSGNSAFNNGGGLIAFYGATTLTNCTVSGNSALNNGGGGIVNEGTATLTNCTISDNSATVNGGGVWTNTGRQGHADQLHRQRQFCHRQRRRRVDHGHTPIRHEY